MAKQEPVETAAEAIAAMGGPTAVARLLNVSGQRVSAWRKNGFPARLYFDLQALFRQQGIRVADSAFSYRPLKATG